MTIQRRRMKVLTQDRCVSVMSYFDKGDFLWV
jgi:hypothetical protein